MSSDRTYVVSASNATVIADGILVFLNPPAGGAAVPAFEITRAWIGQFANATSAQLGVALGTKVSAFPTLTAATPRPTSMSLPASALVGGTNGAAGTAGVAASVNGAGTQTDKLFDTFNTLTGWLWVPPPSETFIMVPGNTSGFYMRLVGTPGTLTGWSFGVAYREL